MQILIVTLLAFTDLTKFMKKDLIRIKSHLLCISHLNKQFVQLDITEHWDYTAPVNIQA